MSFRYPYLQLQFMQEVRRADTSVSAVPAESSPSNVEVGKIVKCNLIRELYLWKCKTTKW